MPIGKGKTKRERQKTDGWRQQAPDDSRGTATSEQYAHLGNTLSMLHLCVDK